MLIFLHRQLSPDPTSPSTCNCLGSSFEVDYGLSTCEALVLYGHVFNVNFFAQTTFVGSNKFFHSCNCLGSSLAVTSQLEDFL
jgi:hypothetical protein